MKQQRQIQANANNYLTIELKGDSLNKEGIGAKIYSYCDSLNQMVEEYPVRGYLSSVDSRVHFGFGKKKPDSLKIIWPDGKEQVLLHPVVNKILEVNYKDANLHYSEPTKTTDSYFTDVTEKLKTDFKHKETFYFDYGIQPLILQKYSQEGPFITVGDMNGDKREDFFIGGAFNQPGKVFLQQENGTFKGKDLITGKKYEEDMQSVLFDANGDGYPDLVVAGGSSEFELTSSFYRPRLYLNDGKGNFKQDSFAFSPLVRTPAKAIAVADIDGDGDKDIFLGGRVALGKYPEPPRSYILRNDHGKFTDVTASVCPALQDIGLINAATWVDLNNDKKPDLIIAADWAPIRIFENNGTTLTEITNQTGLQNYSGMWRSLVVTDVDGDGDLDIIAGNLGLNNPYHINDQQPAELISKDFENKGITDDIICYYIKNNEGKYVLSPGISLDEWSRQMPSVKKRFETNSAYANATMDQVFTKEMMQNSLVLKCNEARSGWFENDGKGHFTFHPFPIQAQVAPINAMVFTDVDGDGNKDIILAGNEYQSNVMQGRYDASYGLLLKGDGKGNFKPVSAIKSNLIIDGDVKDLKLITVGKQKILLVTVNDEKLKALQVKK